MSQLNTGSSMARARVSVITLFGVLLVAFGFLLAALLGEVRSTSASPPAVRSQVTLNDLCRRVVSSPNEGTFSSARVGVAAVSANDVWRGAVLTE